jgi:hypothetical protein
MSDDTLFQGVGRAEWLRYGSYVDEKRRILYVETPKGGCSSIKYLLRGNQPLHFNPAASESRLDMMIHDRTQQPLPALTHFQGAQLSDILSGPGWFRFAVLREPCERFFSAWRDKIFLCEPGFDRFVPRDGSRYVEFTDFAQKVLSEDDPERCDPHWRAQTALIAPDLIAYSRIYDITELSELPGDLAEHLAEIGQETAPLQLRRVNESFSVTPDGFLTPEILAALRHFYRADYSRFTFAPPAVGWAQPRKAADLVNSFTDAVFDRNRTLSAYSTWAKHALGR